MSNIVKIENLEGTILEVRGLRVLIDSGIAQIYGVETRDINKAVANNHDKFPTGYIVGLTKTEKTELVENFHRFEKLKHSTVNPKAFTEKGLYMLATILKSTVATQATISIIETFSKIRELSRNVKELSDIQDKASQKSLMHRSGELIAEILDDDLQSSDAGTSIEPKKCSWRGGRGEFIRPNNVLRANTHRVQEPLRGKFTPTKAEQRI